MGLDAELGAVVAGGLTGVVAVAAGPGFRWEGASGLADVKTGEALTQLNVATFEDSIKFLPNVTVTGAGPGEDNIVMRGLATATYELFAGMIEFGLSRQLTDIVTVTDARMERILRRAGWPLLRIGKAHAIGNTLAVAGYLETSIESLARVRTAGGLTGPVLWAPVASAVA